MLLYLDAGVRDCCRKAKACAQKAAAQSDADVRQSFLDAHESWLKLAKCLAQAAESKCHGPSR
jgi:hypothetical protein